MRYTMTATVRYGRAKQVTIYGWLTASEAESLEARLRSEWTAAGACVSIALQLNPFLNGDSMKKIARIFEECTGKFHVCDDSGEFLDARGHGYNSRNQAIAALRGGARQNYYDDNGNPINYTHYRAGDRIVKL